MSFWFFTALSLTILVPAFAGAVRANRVEPVYFPFLLLLWAGAVNEVTGLVLILGRHDNIELYNVYALLEWWLLLWQFRRWELFDRGGWWYPVLFLAGAAGWVVEGFVMDSLQRPNAYFLIVASLGVVVMSVLTISKAVFFETYRLWQNPKFVICLGFLVFFAFSILIEVFLLFGLGGTVAFRNKIYEIFHCVNALENFLFVYAIICMPTRLQFIGPSPLPADCC